MVALSYPVWGPLLWQPRTLTPGAPSQGPGSLGGHGTGLVALASISVGFFSPHSLGKRCPAPLHACRLSGLSGAWGLGHMAPSKARVVSVTMHPLCPLPPRGTGLPRHWGPQCADLSLSAHTACGVDLPTRLPKSGSPAGSRLGGPPQKGTPPAGLPPELLAARQPPGPLRP